MGWIVEQIVAALPWWVWAIVALAVLYAVHKLFGWRGVWAGLVAFLGLFLFKRGQAVGEGRIEKKNEEAGDELEKEYDDIERNNPPNLDRDIGRLRDD